MYNKVVYLWENIYVLVFEGEFIMGNAYIMVVLGIFLAKGLGFVRDMVFAGVFGTGVMADIYFQVFGLVNLIFTGIGVALSTLVIKNMNKAENAGHQKAYAARFLKKALLYLVIIAGLMVLLTPQIVKLILPEIQGANFDLAVQMTYVMIPSFIFVVIAYIISGILQNEKVYFVTSIMSLPFNVVIILSLMIPDVSIFTVGFVTTIGWFLHIAILLPAFYKKGYSFLKSYDNSIVKKEKNLEIFWIFISNMMFQLCFYLDRAFVSGNDGMASSFNYASNLFVTISSVFVVAMSTVVFPQISKNYEEGKIEYVNKLLQYIITIMTAIFLPFVLVVGFFGTDVIRLLYERGSFTEESTFAVSAIFMIYTLGVLGYIAQELFNKVLYLSGKYKYTVIGTIAVIILNIALNSVMVKLIPDVRIAGTALTYKAIAIAISTAVLFFAYAVTIAVGMKKVVGSYWSKNLMGDISKIFASGIVACLVYVLFNVTFPEFTHGYITFIIPVCACGAAYIITLYATGMLKKLVKNNKEEK